METIERGAYNEILLSSLETEKKAAVEELIRNVQKVGKVDEHGGWEFGIEKSRNGKYWAALNWSLYGIGNDVHSGNLLIVLQVRHSRNTKYGVDVKKNYFLMGENEDGSVFAHPVESAVIHAAIRRDADVVRAVQDWIFDGDYAGMLRQGDLALIPMKRRPAKDTKIARRTMILEGSHILRASSIWQNGTVYAKDPVLVHQPGTHPTVEGKGIFKVVVGNRADFWKFAAPTVD